MNTDNTNNSKNDDQMGEFIAKCIIRAGVTLAVTAIFGPVFGVMVGKASVAELAARSAIGH